jgi:hypothetical protein
VPIRDCTSTGKLVSFGELLGESWGDRRMLFGTGDNVTSVGERGDLGCENEDADRDRWIEVAVEIMLAGREI